MSPNKEQIKTLLMIMIPLVTGFLGFSLGDELVGTFATSGAAVLMGIWSLFANTHGSAVAVVDAIANDKTSPVQAVILRPNFAGRALAKVTSDRVVVAGTDAAAKIAANDW